MVCLRYVYGFDIHNAVCIDFAKFIFIKKKVFFFCNVTVTAVIVAAFLFQVFVNAFCDVLCNVTAYSASVRTLVAVVKP